MVDKGTANSNSASLKPFRLVKFFSFTSLAVFLISTLTLSWIISNYAQKVLLERSEAYAQVFAGNLNHQVFQQFVLPTVLRYGKIALRNKNQFSRLDAIVRNTTHGMNIQSVTIFDSQRNIISYSTTTERVGKEGVGGREYEKALTGEANSLLISTGSLLSFFSTTNQISCELRTYIPFTQEKPLSKSTDLIMGVIEIVRDLSSDFEEIIRFQGMIMLTSILIMSALFAALSLIVVRADRIIEARAKERRQLEEKLNHAERLASLGKMVASVSHEIKNPLGIVRSTAEILGKRLKSVAPGNEHLANIIIEETTRLDGVVREFLDFARPQTPQLTSVSVPEILDKGLQFMQPEFEKRRIRLDASLDHSLSPLVLDQDLVYRAFLNILINGSQAMEEEGGTLTVVVKGNQSQEGEITIEISDTGNGMSPETRQQIFQPFFTSKHRGTGLGLAIVKNTIDNHKGSITVESEEGKGTTFRIILRTA